MGDSTVNPPLLVLCKITDKIVLLPSLTLWESPLFRPHRIWSIQLCSHDCENVGFYLISISSPREFVFLNYSQIQRAKRPISGLKTVLEWINPFKRWEQKPTSRKFCFKEQGWSSIFLRIRHLLKERPHHFLRIRSLLLQSIRIHQIGFVSSNSCNSRHSGCISTVLRVFLPRSGIVGLPNTFHPLHLQFLWIFVF